MTPAENPFLPDGRQWAWNSSSLQPAKACARKYYYQVVRGLRKRALSADLFFGQIYAKSLEIYHRARAAESDHDTAMRAAVGYALTETWTRYDGTTVGGVPWQSDNPRKTRETLIRSIVWYLETYKDDPCKTIQINSGPAVELTFRFQVRDDIWLTGHIDRLVEYAGEQYVQDQKTTGATIGSYYFKRYNPDNQMSLYTLAAGIVWNVPVKGVMIDAAQIAVGFTRFERGFTFRTPEQNDEWLYDTIYAIERIWEAPKRGWPMNDAACMMYGGCEYMEVCSKSPQVRQDFLNTGFEERRYSPL